MKIEKIYSKKQPQLLLHVINRLVEFDGRNELIPPNNFIQCALLKMEEGKTFLPHKHITKDRHYKEQIAQESWVVIKGKVKCKLYDIDDTVISQPILEAGDASFTLYGGHTYEILEDDTLSMNIRLVPMRGKVKIRFL